MGATRQPPLVTPLVAMLAGDAARFQLALPPLEALFGPLEFESETFPFEHTEYYAATMGRGLLRKFFSFQNLADAAGLSAWKIATNALELELSKNASGPVVPERPINLDPGYITGAKLVLASTKDFAHRIYLRDGIFAEITLAFKGGEWVSHALTFPDFKSGRYGGFLSRVRERHLEKAKVSLGK